MSSTTTQDAVHCQLPISILFAAEGLNFTELKFDDPVLTGRQIVVAAGLNPNKDFSVFEIMANGDFEDIRQDETVNLRSGHQKKFVVFDSDRLFKLTVNGAQVSWGKSLISGSDLYALSKPSDGDAVFLTVRGGEDREIEVSEEVDLSAPGIEHFENAPKRIRAFEIVINGHETVVHQKQLSFEELVKLAYPGDAPSPNITYSITYRKVASVPHQGELGAGGSVQVQNGSVFNVGRTVQS